MQNIKVLMADDDAQILKNVSKKVAAEGFEVVTAVNGEEAWKKIQSENPDIILLDLDMPKMHGFEVLKALRENPPSDKFQPVIIVSGRDELEDMHKGFELEADHYITKPCGVHDIIKSLKLMIGLIPHRDTGQDDDEDEE